MRSPTQPSAAWRCAVNVVCGAPCGLADHDEDQGPRRYEQALLLCVVIVVRLMLTPTASVGSRRSPAPALDRRGEGLDPGREPRPGDERVGGGAALRAAPEPAVRLAATARGLGGP